MENKYRTFKPFDKVIYRLIYHVPTTWHCGIFSDYNEQNNHITLCSGFAFNLAKYDILPYESNEHLVGTTDEPEEEIKLEKGEWLMVCDDRSILPEEWRMRKYDGTDSSIRVFNNSSASLCGWNYAVRFSDFNPNDMKETRRHILCVKNSKVVKYKG